MRIAIVHNFYKSDSPSGENIAVVAQRNVLETYGHDVRIFSTSSDDISNNPLTLLKVSLDVAKGTGAASGLVDDIELFKPDIIHVHNTFPLMGSSWMNEVSAPVVSTLHNFRPVCSSGLLTRNNHDCLLCPEKSSLNAVIHSCYRDSSIKSIPLAVATRAAGSKNNLLNQSQVLIVLSEYAESVYRRYSLDANKIVRIPNFSPLTIRAAVENNLTAGWIYVGRLSPEKGILELVKNWPNNEKLCIYGSGILQSQIKELIREKPNIHFMGQISREDLGKILSRAKGLIFPSTCRENSPMIYVEALSSGLPVLAYSANSVAELVRKDNSGYVFDSWMDLQTALEVFSKSRDSYSRNALAAAQRQYSPDAWYKKTLAAYQSARKNFQNLN